LYSAIGIQLIDLVDSLATAIDVYCPKYAVLENVAGIAHSPSNANGEEVNTYTVMLWAIVGLGYQIESFPADAWSHGN
jgi:DNA (cytosine-5)-methyltransferase 1